MVQGPRALKLAIMNTLYAKQNLSLIGLKDLKIEREEMWKYFFLSGSGFTLR
jgi:hypothetical protein